MPNETAPTGPFVADAPEGVAGGRRARRPRGLRAVSTLVVLVAALLVVAALAFQAYRAEQDQRATVAGTLREYAGVAAWQFAADAKNQIGSALSELLGPVQQLDLHPGRVLPSPKILVASQHRVASCDCGTMLLPAAYYFRLDLRTRALHTVGDHPPDALEQLWLTDTVARYTRFGWDKHWRIAFISGSVGHARRTAAYTVVRDSGGTPIAVYGLVNDSNAFAAAVFPAIMNGRPLLPPSLIGARRTGTVLSVRVTDESGNVVYASVPQYDSSYTSYYPLPRYLGGLTVHTVIRPESAGLLVPGGAPHRFLLMVGLLLLTAFLVAIAFRQLRREAALAAMRADFVSSVSHELRTPLAQIRMFAELLRMGWVRSDQERRRSLEIIDQESRRLANLVDTVLAFDDGARIRPGAIQPEFTRLAPLVTEIIEAFQPLADSKHVCVSPLLDADCAASVDRGAVRQVLINLLDNAVKYGPPGQTVRVTLQTVAGCARLSVEDEGQGVPPDARAAIWEPFERLTRDAHSAVGGSGIGLSVVKRLVEAHHGTAGVEGCAAGGARFVVEFPVAS